MLELISINFFGRSNKKEHLLKGVSKGERKYFENIKLIIKIMCILNINKGAEVANER